MPVGQWSSRERSVLAQAAEKRQWLSILEEGEWCFLNERGMSWAETMVSLFMVFIIFGSLLPAMLSVQQSLQVKKERVSAFETLHEAAREIHSTGALHGRRSVNGIVYSWEMADSLCVDYADFRGQQERLCSE